MKSPKQTGRNTPKVTFLTQKEPIDEYGRALYAVARSIFRAFVDSLSNEDLADINTELADVRMRQFAKIVRLDRDKGMKGDGFEWAVHEAILGQEQGVLHPVHAAMQKASPKIRDEAPTSVMFGYERAKFLGFTDAVIGDAGRNAVLLPDGRGRPPVFDRWVAEAAAGKSAESRLPSRIQQIWKTDLFLSTMDDQRYLAATVKSNVQQLEGGRGLRVAIVPESTSTGNRTGPYYDRKRQLWVTSLADPNGFMGLYNDAYMAVGRAMCALGKQQQPPYYTKPSAKGIRLQEQLEKYPDGRITDIEGALDEAAQQNLVGQSTQLIGVNAPDWLHIKKMAPKIIAPKPVFTKLD